MQNEISKMNKPQKHLAKWNMPDIEDHILYNFTYTKYPDKPKLQRQKLDYWLHGAGHGNKDLW